LLVSNTTWICLCCLFGNLGQYKVRPLVSHFQSFLIKNLVITRNSNILYIFWGKF